VFAEHDFSYVVGVPTLFARSDLQVPVQRYFCNNCGTAIGNMSPLRPRSVIVKVGTLDDPSVFVAKLAIFTRDWQPFQHIKKCLPQYDRRPPKTI